jgi:hypothetical protein
MRTVPRHQLDLAWAEDQAGWFHEVIFEDHIPRLTSEPGRTDALLRDADMELKYRCAGDPTARLAATWESATLALQAGSALYMTGLQSEGTVECVVHDVRVALPAVGPQWWMDISRWQTAVHYAMICRDRERTDLLCSVPQQFLRASTGGAVSPWAYPFFEAIKGWWRREEDYYSHLLEAAERANPDDPALASWGVDHIALNVFPQIRMFEALVGQQPAQFNDALADALEGHRTFWTSTPERARNPDGYVALAPLAFACLARESGFTIEVQSEYLPQHLLEGTWVGAFPT